MQKRNLKVIVTIATVFILALTGLSIFFLSSKEDDAKRSNLKKQAAKERAEEFAAFLEEDEVARNQYKQLILLCKEIECKNGPFSKSSEELKAEKVDGKSDYYPYLDITFSLNKNLSEGEIKSLKDDFENDGGAINTLCASDEFNYARGFVSRYNSDNGLDPGVYIRIIYTDNSGKEISRFAVF